MIAGGRMPKYRPEISSKVKDMSLRDYIAITAMQQMIVSDSRMMTTEGQIAKKAYSFANAMIKERNSLTKRGDWE